MPRFKHHDAREQHRREGERESVDVERSVPNCNDQGTTGKRTTDLDRPVRGVHQ